MAKKILRLFIVFFFLLFTWPIFLYKVLGNKQYKLKGNTIIIANHYSNYDPFFIYLYFFKYHINFVTIIDVKKKLFTRFITWLFDCLYVNYHGTNLGFFKKAIKILKNNGIICIFPEGEINPSKYGFFEFYESYLHIAKKANSSILPLYIYPELKFFKKSTLYIGEIIPNEKIANCDNYMKLNIHIQTLIFDYYFKVEELSKL